MIRPVARRSRFGRTIWRGCWLIIAEDRPSQRTAGPTQVLVELAEILSHELAGETAEDGREPVKSLRRMLPPLEGSLARYDEHRRREIVEVFLTIVNRENHFCGWCSAEPRHPAHRDMVDLLTYSGKPSIVRLLASFSGRPNRRRIR